MKALKSILLSFCLVGIATNSQAQPLPNREMRATWLTTVSNLDWPNRFDTPAEQKEELIQILNELEDLNVNAVVFQIRPECDAFYLSEIEPWSRYLTNASGRAPDPLWDPLSFAIDETQRRGMELHAWMNPYRAASSRFSSFSSDHVSNDMPEIVTIFDNLLILDPGNPQTLSYTFDVVEDVVTRYDIDAIHFDDYFYPYETNSIGFDDAASFQNYNPDNLDLGDWRRQNINQLVEGVYDTIHSVPGKNHVRFGISPFGIWQPGNPSGIQGFNSYSGIYADTRLWLREGWVDYMTPQIYWGRAADGYSSQQDFDALIGWWASPSQNPLGRQVFAGLPTYKAASGQITNPQHIINMHTTVRNTAGAQGVTHFRTDNLLSNTLGVESLLKSGQWSKADYVVPEAPWLSPGKPDFPTGFVWSRTSLNSSINAQWDMIDETETNYNLPRWYVAQWQGASGWDTEVIPGWKHDYTYPPNSTSISIRAVNRVGTLSDPNVKVVSGLSNGATDFSSPWTLVENFESAPSGSEWMFRDPAFSGSRRNASSVSETAVTTEDWNNRLDPYVGNQGRKSARLSFSWQNTGDSRVRVTTAGGNGRPNPTVDFSKGISFAFKLTEGSLDLSLLLRETGASGPIGADGGSTGGIEQTTERVRLEASPNWQYVYFDLPNLEYDDFASADGTLNGNFGTLDALLIEEVIGDPTLNFELYVDDIWQGPKQNPFGDEEQFVLATAIDVDNVWMFR